MAKLGMADSWLGESFHPLRRLRLVSPGGGRVEVALRRPRDGIEPCIVPRTVFDTMLYEHALSAGARFEVAHVEGPVVEAGRVVGVRVRDEGERVIGARVVIGADGATSAIARGLRRTKSPEMHRAVALRAYVDDFDVADHMAEVHYVSSLLPGYGWIFSMGGRSANIGVGMRLDHFRERGTTLLRLLDEFVALPSIMARMGPSSTPRDVLVWQLNFGSETFPRAWDGALLIGDAGGFISPLTGGGIHNGMITGLAAAKTAIRAIDAGDTGSKALEAFERAWRRSLGFKLRAGYAAQCWLVGSPRRVDRITSLLARYPSFAPSD